MQKLIYSFFSFLLFFFSCNLHKNQNCDQYTLKATPTKLSFPLDEKTKIYIFSLQPYTDSTDTEYLVFQNQTYSQLLFYNMNTQKLYKKIDCAYEGPEAVRKFNGFFVRNMNEIYVTHSNHNGLTLIDGEGKPLKIYKNETKDGTTISTNPATARDWIQDINNKLYIPLSLNREWGEDVKLQKSNLCATLDLKTQELELLPLTHFDIVGREGDDLIVLYYSRCTNGKQFIYSFEDSENLFVTDLEHTSLKKIKAKSRFLPTLQFKPQEYSIASPDNCSSLEQPRYGTILYDPYRKVYYWIAYPKAEIEKDVNCFDLMACGRKNFSVIILNEDFEIIGETLMPDYTYNPRLCFVRKDGLYISESHIFNPDFDENELSFRRFSFEPL